MEYELHGEIVEFRKKDGYHSLQVGDRLRVDIPDESDADFDRWHERTGEVVYVLVDNAGDVTGDRRDNTLFRVRADDGEEMDFRWQNLRPVNRDERADLDRDMKLPIRSAIPMGIIDRHPRGPNTDRNGGIV